MARFLMPSLILTLIPLLILLPHKTDASFRKHSLRVRRARLGQGRLPPLLLSLPSQVQEVAVAPAGSAYLSPSASEPAGVANTYLSPLPSDPPADFLLPLPTEAPAGYLAPQPSDTLPSVADYLGPIDDPVGYPDTQSVDITYLPPRDDPPTYGEVEGDSPNQPTNPSSCTVVEETVVDLVEETQCRQMVRCKELIQCRVTRETVCSNVTEEVPEEQCQLVDGPEECEDIVRTVIETECNVVTEEKCEEEYVVEYKEECEYSTVQDEVCSSGYSPSYSDECVTQRAPGRAPRRLCRKVPQFPINTCRLVARQVPDCKQVPVQRPSPNCQPQEREVCNPVAQRVVEEECRFITRNQCSTVNRPTEREVCEEEEDEQCGEVEEQCADVEEDCREVIVEKPRTVSREVCDQTTDDSSLEVSQGYLGPPSSFERAP